VAIVGEGATYGATIAPNHVGFWVVAGFELAFDGTPATAPLFECFFGMSVGVVDGFSGLTQVMEVTQLVGCLG
jgi:hypothetical protein